MEKVCPNCGKALPEEAEFCLYCFTDIKGFKKKAEEDALPAVEESRRVEAQPSVKAEKKSKKAALCRIACVVAFLFVILLCGVAMKSCGKENTLAENQPMVTQTTVVKETVAVVVTDSVGEEITDSQGEQVTDIVEVTKTEIITVAPTTQKQGFFDKIFSTTAPNKKDEATTKEIASDSTITGDNTTGTTEKPGFIDGIIDSIFGDDKGETTAPEAEKVTTEPCGTTAPNTVLNTTAPSATAPATKPGSLPSTTQNATQSATTTGKPATTTQKPVTTTQRPVTTTQAQTTSATSPESDFEYTISGKYATITKYTGDDKYVTIPAVIGGYCVTTVSQNCFMDNNTVEVVTFADDSRRPYLWVYAQSFNNCSNLRIINMPDEDLGILNNFAYNCPSVEKITLKNNQYRYENGALFYSGGTGWRVRYFCPAADVDTFTLPLWSTGFEGACNLKESSVKTIVLHKDTVYFPEQRILPSTLENIFVDDGCTKGYDINGIAFSIGSEYVFCAYPNQNKTSELTLPENTLMYGQYIRNSNLKTLRIPKTAKVHMTSGKTFSGLENLYIEDGQPDKATLIAEAQVDNIYIY